MLTALTVHVVTISALPILLGVAASLIPLDISRLPLS